MEDRKYIAIWAGGSGGAKNRNQAAKPLSPIHHILLNKLRKADKIDFSRAVVDSASVRAVLGGKKQAQIPRTDAKMAASTM
jgi:hypothetical protein